MSRIGNTLIQIPEGVTICAEGDDVTVNGPLGQLKINMDPRMKLEIENQKAKLTRTGNERDVRSLHGLNRALIANMVSGVKNGWQKKLELVGVGFRAQGGGDKITLNVGFSHPVEVQAPAGILFEVKDNTKITVSGIDKYLVGQIAANVRKIKPPDVYKGKGIRYEGEYIRRKAGKAGKVGIGGAK